MGREVSKAGELGGGSADLARDLAAGWVLVAVGSPFSLVWTDFPRRPLERGSCSTERGARNTAWRIREEISGRVELWQVLDL